MNSVSAKLLHVLKFSNFFNFYFAYSSSSSLFLIYLHKTQNSEYPLFALVALKRQTIMSS